MKKTKKYYSVNNQEDEDGYIPDPRNAIIKENGKRKEDKNLVNNADSESPGKARTQFRGFIHYPSEIVKGNTEK